MAQIRVLIANHQPLVRNGLRSLLERDGRARVVGEAATGREAIILARYQHPDVGILDINLHAMRGIEAARILTGHDLRTRLILLGSMAEETYVQEAFLAGARGYVFTDCAVPDLLRAVSVVAAGGVFLSPFVASVLLRGRASDFDLQVISRLLEGKGAPEVINELMISEDQVCSACARLRAALERLGVPLLLHPALVRRN